MDLILKRIDKGGNWYDLFAKLELTAEEEVIIQKTDPANTLIMEGDTANAGQLWFWSVIMGAFLALILAIIGVAAVAPGIVVVPIAILAWFPLSKVVYNQFRKDVYVQDLLTGRTIRCKNLQELAENEHKLTENAKKLGKLVDSANTPTLTDEQRIRLN
jgi:hypothetical protein